MVCRKNHGWRRPQVRRGRRRTISHVEPRLPLQSSTVATVVALKCFDSHPINKRVMMKAEKPDFSHSTGLVACLMCVLFGTAPARPVLSLISTSRRRRRVARDDVGIFNRSHQRAGQQDEEDDNDEEMSSSSSSLTDDVENGMIADRATSDQHPFSKG